MAALSDKPIVPDDVIGLPVTPIFVPLTATLVTVPVKQSLDVIQKLG